MIGAVLAGWGILAVGMSMLWWRQLRTRNATSVDVAWSAGLAFLSIWYAGWVEADLTRVVVVATLGAIWASRLAWFLFKHRVLAHTIEDGRYQALRQKWGGDAPRNFFLFYQAQAAVAVLFSLPLLAAMRGGPMEGLHWVGVIIWGIALLGESVADLQLAQFRANPKNRGEVCQVGLWRYSRHPNYFFEWLQWWSWVVLANGALLSWIGPILMFLFLFRLTGIPHTEAQALRSRGEKYRRYQASTSIFIPWWPRSGA